MAGIGGSLVMGRMVSLTRTVATVRGIEIMDNPRVPIVALGPRARLSPTIFSSSSRAFLHSHTRIAGFDPSTTGAAMLANSAHFRRSPQLERLLNPRPWDARRCFSVNSSASGGALPSPGPFSFIVELIEKIFQFLATLLPTKALIQQVEAEVDAAAAMVEEGAKLVTEIADKVEVFANAAELGAEEVERIAQKIEEVAKKVQKIVDDVADILEGEKGASTLVGSVKQLKNVAAAKRAQSNYLAEARNSTTTVSAENSEATTITANPEAK